MRQVERSRRRARKYGASGGLSVADWRRVRSLFGERCASCGADGPLTIDHIVALRDGGPDNITNIQPLCAVCNDRKGRQVIDYRPPHLLAALGLPS